MAFDVNMRMSTRDHVPDLLVEGTSSLLQGPVAVGPCRPPLVADEVDMGYDVVVVAGGGPVLFASLFSHGYRSAPRLGLVEVAVT